VRIALVGSGGSGKSTLACAVGHRLAGRFPGGIEWFRVGAWDTHTLLGMFAVRLGLPLRVGLRGIRDALMSRKRMLFVLDNHEDDAAVAEILDGLRDAPCSWLITARRCLIAGVGVFPVSAPMVTTGKSPFPRVRALTELLRWSPLALELADALVVSGDVTARELRDTLLARGIDRVRALEHEDDLPEVELLAGWAYERLPAPARRMLAVLAHTGGDHLDRVSLARLARATSQGVATLDALRRYRLVQEPLTGRYALHATVRHAIAKRTKPHPRRSFDHYVSMLERHPERFELEQTHLFAAMDYAHHAQDLSAALRVDRVVADLEARHAGR
jgi:hypothetical protein